MPYTDNVQFSPRVHRGEYLVNIGYGRRAAQKRVTGGRWRRIVLGHVLAEQVVVVEEVVRVSGRRGSGSFGSDRTAGYAIGEGRTSPWLEAIAGIRERSCPRLDSKPLPAPRTRSGVRDMSPSDFPEYSPPRPSQAPHPERQKMWSHLELDDAAKRPRIAPFSWRSLRLRVLQQREARA